VDFVTALSVDDCRARLEEAAARDALQLTLADEGSFALRRAVGDSQDAEVRFWGTLETVERGTWVWGAILEDVVDEDAEDHISPLRAFVVVGLLFLGAEALLRDDLRMMFFWGGTLVFLAVVAVLVWRRTYRHALALVNWIYETIYVPAPRANP
jgi:hypothetical protein